MRYKTHFLPLIVVTSVLSLAACNPDGGSSSAASGPGAAAESWVVGMSMSGGVGLASQAELDACELRNVDNGSVVQLVTTSKKCVLNNHATQASQYIVFDGSNGADKLVLYKHDIMPSVGVENPPTYYTIKAEGNTNPAVDVTVVTDTFATLGYTTRVNYRCSLQDEFGHYNSNSEYVLYYPEQNNFHNHRIDLNCANALEPSDHWKLSIHPSEIM